MKISTQEPVNKTAAIVTQKASANNSFDAEADLKYRRFDEVWKAPKKHKRFNGDADQDLTGVKLIRSVVTGFIGGKRFQLRCVCGNYYQRKSKSIKSGRPIHGICGECLRRYDMVRHNDYLKSGSNKHDIDWYVLNR